MTIDSLYDRAKKRARKDLAQRRASGRRDVRREVVGKPRSRKEVVEAREVKRLELRKADPRFADREKVSGAVAQRSGARLAALGGSVKGVDGTDGYTGREARLIRDARAAQKDGRKTIRIDDPVRPDRERTAEELEDQVGDRRRDARRPPQLQGGTLKQLAMKRLRGRRAAGGELRVPPRPGEPVAWVPEMPVRRRRAARQPR